MEKPYLTLTGDELADLVLERTLKALRAEYLEVQEKMEKGFESSDDFNVLFEEQDKIWENIQKTESLQRARSSIRR